jgi:hypothetical protein
MSKAVRYGGTAVLLNGPDTAIVVPENTYSRPTKVTISGKNFIKDGVEWKPFGFQGEQPGDHNGESTRWSNGTSQSEVEIDALNRFRKHLGSNCIRVYAHQWAVMEGGSYAALQVRQAGMDKLMYQIESAARLGMHTYLTLNVHFHGAGSVDMPTWYQNHGEADETEHWNTQQATCEAIVSEIVSRGLQDCILAYDLINEPPSLPRPEATDYFGPEAFVPGTGLYYNAVLSMRSDADSSDILAWATQMSNAIKAIDPDALVTGGHLTLKGPDGTPITEGSFSLDLMDDLFDFHSPHISPSSGQIDANVSGTFNWVNSTSKPVMIGENHAIATLGNREENKEYLRRVGPHLQGVIGFLPYALLTDLESDVYPDMITMPPEIASGTSEEQGAWYVQNEGTLALLESKEYIIA